MGQELILNILKQTKRWMKSKEIMLITKITGPSLRKSLSNLRKYNMLQYKKMNEVCSTGALNYYLYKTKDRKLYI